jgi:hypothetical protein
MQTSAQAEEAESKYIYFVLAASGASLGYVLEKHSEARGLTLSYSVLLMAVFCWLLSFLFGLRAAQHRITSLNLMANVELLERMLQTARRNMPPAEVQRYEVQFSENIKATNQALDVQSKRFHSYVSWQFRLLAGGALAYTSFHLLPLAPLQ